MHTATPYIRDLVLVGGGHAHALVLRKWGMRPLPGVRLTVIDPTPVTAYSGMLPGFVAGHYPMAALEIDLVKLARFANARLVMAPVIGLDPVARSIEVPGRAPIRFDVASLNLGITARMPDLPGFTEFACPAKPLAIFAQRWDGFVAQVATGELVPQVAMIGGGIAGVELALTLHHRLTQVAKRPVEVTVLDRATALPGINARSQRLLRARLAAAGIALLEGVEVAEVTGDGVVLADGRLIAAALTVGAAGATPHPWVANSGLGCHAGFVSVDSHLRSLTHPHVFAAGDCAHLSAAPRPKAGVFAVRAAPVLDHNLRAVLSDRPTRPWTPQKSYLKLITLGPKSALAQKGPLSLAGPAMWRWKDHIDRKFMAMLQDLPAMARPALPHDAPPALRREISDKPLCGGCGAKVGPGALGQALACLPPQSAAGLETQPGDDAAILRSGDTWQVLSTDHLRAVTEDPGLMTQIAFYHAMGDVWAMGATPQLALAQIIVPRMSDALQARTLAEITDAATRACAVVGAALAGGHTTLGAEMTIGFTVTGTSTRPPIRKSGARPGDILLLTRPLGSGTLLAAEMQGQAEGRWMAGLYSVLTTGQGLEAAILAQKAHAMTDVTGFGLAGHALEMAQASGTALRLDLADVPMFDGAAALAAAGLRSTIYDANRRAVVPMAEGQVDAPEAVLTFDPQTGGGLLAALSPQDAMEAVAQIAAAGGAVWTIGTVMAGPPRVVFA